MLNVHTAKIRNKKNNLDLASYKILPIDRSPMLILYTLTIHDVLDVQNFGQVHLHIVFIRSKPQELRQACVSTLKTR